MRLALLPSFAQALHAEPVSVAALGAAPPELRAALTEDVLAGRLATIGELLPRLSPAAREAVLDAVEETRPPADLFDRTIASALLESMSRPPLRNSWEWYPVGHILRKTSGAPKAVREALQSALSERLARVEAAWRDEQRRSVRRSVRPAEPLTALWAALHRTREALRKSEVPEGEVDRFDRWSTTEYPDHVRFHAGAHTVVVAVVDGQTLLPGVGRDLRWALGAIDRLLDAIADPNDPLHAAIVAVRSVPDWLRQLEHLDRALAAGRIGAVLLGWRVVRSNGGDVVLKPVLCNTSSRQAPKAVRHDDVLPEQMGHDGDARALALTTGWRPQPPAEHAAAAVEALIDHPRLFAGAKGVKPLTIRRRSLALSLDTVDGQVVPRVAVDGVPVAIEELRDHVLGSASGSTWLRWVEQPAVDELQIVHVRRAVAMALASWVVRARALPPEALPALVERLPALVAQVPVQVSEALRGRPIEPDRRPLLRVRWDGQELQIDARVRPLPEHPAYEPGDGLAELVTVRDGEACHVARDLASEADDTEEALAPLALPAEARTGWRWTLQGREEALGVLAAIAERPGAYQTAWEGSPPTFHRVSARQVKISARGAGGWFDVDGQVEVDGQRVPLATVLEAVREGTGYVQVKPGVFARLAEELRRGLGAVAAAEEEGRLSVLHASAVDALAQLEVEVEADRGFAASLDRLRAAADLEIAVPRGLRAELRPYQLDGFRWLARLASWAPGAVLADDMGLGKTVQAIALLLRRAADGPALVVSPLSVTANWADELARFAPSLKVVTYQGSGREAQLEKLGAKHVVLCTWDILARDERLAGVRWATAVLDEAQAIKNSATARAKGAARLDAGFTLALSGTPVENRVEELWSLLRVVAPGLLGGERRFAERFVKPIAGRVGGSREALARVVSPFVLRRTKRQVATDLPERSEVVLRVPLSPDERALYERARVEALVRTSEGGPKQRFEVFRWLTHLRQVACNPRLTDPGSPVASSKMEMFRRRIADLRASGHRTLVFSQFVRHLELAREALEADGVSYRWLTGESDAAARRREVEAFQAGKGDVFLISLGAGGTGLNLTAATYVFHLDPWWNPAKEDQASDRAHRIGQTQPVTVYRLVAEGTIEERILALHAEKRDLADALLAGAGRADQVSTEELLALLAEAGPVVAPAEPEPDPVPLETTATNWQEVWAAHVQEQLAAGTMSSGTAQQYTRAVERMACWDQATSDIADTGRRWIDEVAAGRAGTRSDRSYARPAVGRLLRLLTPAG